VRWGLPPLDAFAKAAVGQHKTANFGCPGSAGIIAMHCDWSDDTAVHGRSLSWVFPPFRSVGAVIDKLLHERVNAILIVIYLLRYWTAMLQQLQAVDVVQLPYYAGLYGMRSRAPKNMQGNNKRRTSLTAYVVQFPSPLVLLDRCSSMCFTITCFVHIMAASLASSQPAPS